MMAQPKHEGSAKDEEGGTKQYTLSDDSASYEVVVDNKTVAKGGKPVALTQDQYDRASAIDGVELVEAGSEKDKEE